MEKQMHLFDLHWEDIIMSSVIPHLTIRECFNFRCVSKTCLQIINIYFAKLKSLNLQNKGFSPHTFKVFSTHCTKLTVLNLSRCEVTDADLIPLLLQNRNLVSLNLSQCKNLSAKCLQPVILYGVNLRCLKLAQCPWLTTGAVEALALHQCTLEEVDLSHCPLLPESCIIIFIKKFQRLSTLNLSGNIQITDKTLYALAKYSRELKLLNLCFCVDVSDKGIKALSQNSLNLSGLLVRGCSRITEHGLKALRGRVFVDKPKPAHTIPWEQPLLQV